MRIGRLALVGVVAVAVAGAGLAGCATSKKATPSGGTSAAATSASPNNALTQAIAMLAKTSYTIKATSGPMEINGSIDPASRSGHIRMVVNMAPEPGKAELKTETITISGEFWGKIDFGSGPDQWMHFDPARLVAIGGELPLDPKSPDLISMNTWAAAMTEVTRVDAAHYAGTLDLTKVTGPTAPTEIYLKPYGEKVKAVPFTATLDDKGHLANLKIDHTVLKIDEENTGEDLKTEFSFSDFGTAPKIAKPAAAIEAPETFYKGMR